MKAAILFELGKAPVYGNFTEPVPESNEQLVLTVKAASIKNLDKLRAGGKHYASYTHLPVVVGIDGVGTLEDGTKVYAQGLTGMLGEKALITKGRYTVLPDNISLVTAAALPNAVIGATMALHARAKIKQGDVVLVNGATGVTGQLAVQVAKYYGASKIIVTGRNADSLEKLKQLGADVCISLKQDDETIIKHIKEIHKSHPINIVIDYLWGHPIELIIKSLKGGGINTFTSQVKIITVGDMAGHNITLDSGTLRSSAIELMGSGLGSLSQADIQAFNNEILPEMFQLAADGKLSIDTHVESLKDIEAVWHKEIAPGKRMVITI